MEQSYEASLGLVPLRNNRASAWVVAAASNRAATVVRAGAVVASLGSLLALIAGIGRTTLAMAREGDLPRWLAAVDARRQVPHHAEVAVAQIVSALALTLDLRGAIGFSSFGVLTYYAIANAAALSQGAQHRIYPRVLQVVGLAGCVVLAFTVPLASLVAGVLILLAGVSGRAVVVRRRAGAVG